MTITSTGAVFFYPESNSTLVCTTTTGNVTIGGSGDVLVIANVGTVEAFVGWGNDATPTVVAGGTITAGSTGGMSVPPGIVTTVRSVPSSNIIAGITNAGTTTLRISRGSGQ